MSKTQGKILDPEKSRLFLGTKVGPFRAGQFRVSCPLFKFALRKTEKCIGCEHFSGLVQYEPFKEGVKYDKSNEIIIMKKFRIFCKHPVTRRISYFPED